MEAWVQCLVEHAFTFAVDNISIPHFKPIIKKLNCSRLF